MNSPALNQSALKMFLLPDDQRNHRIETGEAEIFKSDPVYYTIGGAVDMLLTGFEGDFDKTYHVSSLDVKPSDAVINIINTAIQGVEELTDSLEAYGEEILQACLLYGYQPNWKDETKVRKIVEVARDYFEELKLSAGKKILSANDMQIVEAIVDGIKNKYVSYFDESSSQSNVDIYFQKPIYFNYRNTSCKALPDIIVKTTSPGGEITIVVFDIKTTGGYISDFPNAAFTYRYDIQQAWYRIALRNSSEFNNAYKYESKFIVASKLYNQADNFEFVCSENYIDRATIGCSVRYPVEISPASEYQNSLSKKEFLGINQLMERCLRTFTGQINIIPKTLL